MKVLSISDIIIPFLYSSQVKQYFGDVDSILACGDLPYYYQEYMISMLNVPLFFVHGNHDPVVEHGAGGNRKYPHGGINLHRAHYRKGGVLMAGVEGSVRYNRRGIYQYTQEQMWWHVFSLIPGLIRNRLICGRYLDIFMTHASPWGIHDESDWTHQGIKAFRWFIKVFKPAYHFHGHIHVYRPDTVTETTFKQTRVINTFGYREFELEFPTGK